MGRIRTSYEMPSGSIIDQRHDSSINDDIDEQQWNLRKVMIQLMKRMDVPNWHFLELILKTGAYN